MVLQLINVKRDENGVLVPESIIVEPDYLVDVTAVARCRDMDRFDPRLFLLQKFQRVPNSLHIILGNIANFFLDELVRQPDQRFETLFAQVFKMNPIGLSLFPDHTLKQLMSDARNHFINLKRVLSTDFQSAGIQPANSEIEPSFFSADYGIQGRLDLLSVEPEDGQLTIVELKSGRPFTKATSTLNLKADHYVQTLLYDLLIKSVYPDQDDAKKYILYSKLADQSMRFAPTYKVLQQEALEARNQIMALERQFMQLDDQPYEKPNFLDRLPSKGYLGLSRFNQRDLEAFHEKIDGLGALQRHYFLAFAAFIAREQYLSRVGDGLNNSRSGMARLWLNNTLEKEENFELFRELTLIQQQVMEPEPLMLFEKSIETNPMANFRVGDLALVYPIKDDSSNAINSRIYRGTIIELSDSLVTFRLRATQSQDRIFEMGTSWNMEPDHYDGSNQLYRNLYEFMSFPPQVQNPILGVRPPLLPMAKSWAIPSNFTEEQVRILHKALNAEEYFLLLGPPGTGKTKFMLSEMVRQLLMHSEEQILLLAYTNRAVDEICDAIHGFAAEQYLRIGKRTSCEARFLPNLLEERIHAVKNRKMLKQLIRSHRIMVSTVASIAGKYELWEIKSFDRIIVDEASQILEPALIHLLAKAKRFVLVGDHKQLPAVVIQSKLQSAVRDKKLQEIGLSNRRNSLFERLYRLAIKHQWAWAYDMLSHQGRMHQDIAAFANQRFYGGQLKQLPEGGPDHWQEQELHLPEGNNKLGSILAKQRILFFDVPPKDKNDNPKSNLAEANAILQLVKAYRQIYRDAGALLRGDQVGVITPFRAQIAQIKSVLEKADPEFAQQVTIDTVERYQGGARDLILISFCVNQPYQLEALVSISDDGLVDRKLNVALTRARQHLAMVGDRNTLEQHPVYKDLISFLDARDSVNPFSGIEE